MKNLTSRFQIPLLGFAILCGTQFTVADEGAAKLRALLEENSVDPLDPKPEVTKELLELGQALFFDPLIGGNRDVSCATCHHPKTATADG